MEGQGRVDHDCDPPLRDGADFGDRQCDHVRRERDRFGMEVSARNDFVPLDQDKRIVGYGVGFDLQRPSRHIEKVQRGASHLRLASDAIGILDSSIPFAMAVPDFRPLNDVTDRPRNALLSGMAPQLVYFRKEWRCRPHDGIRRERGGNDRLQQVAFCIEQSRKRAGR